MASIRNHIWGVEPQNMQSKVEDVPRKRFCTIKEALLAWISPVPPQVE